MKINGLFDEEKRLKTIDELGDPLQKLEKWVDWEVLNEVLKKREVRNQLRAKGAGGRPAYDSLLILKMLILQKLYNLSDDQVEYQCKDRLTFTRFLGLALGDAIPDAKTIWHYREKWTKTGLLDELFHTFRQHLEQEEVITRSGSIVDASFINRRRQMFSKQEYEQIKRGEVPERIKEKEGRLRQTDLDARVVKRNGVVVGNGYKLHIKVDAESKCVVQMKATPANVSDVDMAAPLMDKHDKVLYADKGYVGEDQRKKIENRVKGKGGEIDIQIHERASRGHPLSEEAQERNRQRSKIRVAVEHVFGAIKHDCNWRMVYSVGLMRAYGHMLLAVLTYNLKRSSMLLERAGKKPGRTVPA